MVFLLWAHSGNGNRLESTYYHWGAAFLWAAIWWGSRRKVGETVNMYTEKGKMWKKPPSEIIFIPAATFLFNSKLRNHLWLTIMEGARLRCKQVPIWTEKNQISLWRCWNDINFPNQTQTSTCNLQLRNITFTSPREDLIDRTPPSLMDQNFAAMSVVWKMLDDIIMVSVLKFPPTIISPLLLLGR